MKPAWITLQNAEYASWPEEVQAFFDERIGNLTDGGREGVSQRWADAARVQARQFHAEVVSVKASGQLSLKIEGLKAR